MSTSRFGSCAALFVGSCAMFAITCDGPQASAQGGAENQTESTQAAVPPQKAVIPDDPK